MFKVHHKYNLVSIRGSDWRRNYVDLFENLLDFHMSINLIRLLAEWCGREKEGEWELLQ